MINVYSSIILKVLDTLINLFRYPNDNNTYIIDTQFLWGSALLISPVLQEVGKLKLWFLTNN